MPHDPSLTCLAIAKDARNKETYSTLHQRARSLAELAGGDTTMHVTEEEWQAIQDYVASSRPHATSRPVRYFDVPGAKVTIEIKKPPLLEVKVERKPYPSDLPDSGLAPDSHYFNFFVRGRQVEAMRMNNDEQQAEALAKWFPDLLNRLTSALTPLLKSE